MKNTSSHNAQDKVVDEMLPEYDFDYRKARPNRFAVTSDKATRTVVLDEDVADVFTTSEAVNTALRVLLSIVPTPGKQRPNNS